MSKYLNYAKTFNASEEVQFWLSHNLVNHLKTATENQDEIEHIIDYLISSEAPKRLQKMSYSEAMTASVKWTKAQQKKGEHIKESESDIETVLDFKDGFKIVKLVGKAAYEREGYLMRHCVGGYHGNGKEIYSLRDSENMPHCTMEKDQQVKGKGNGDIHPKYVEYVVKFLEFTGMTVGDNEMSHLGYSNMEKFKKELSKDTKFFNKKYLPTNEKLIGKDGKEFASFDLWDVRPLVTEQSESLKINFELPVFIKLSFEYMVSQTKKILSTDKISDGHSAKNASSGHSATNASSGDYAKNASSGHSAKNASSGDYATNAMEGSHSVSVDAGHNGKAKGKIGCWFCLSEWKSINDTWTPICVKAVQIDGKIIKEDVWYQLKDGEFVEVN